MISEFEKDNFLSTQKLSANPDFYNNVFKRAERISSVVFYILSHIDVNKRTELHHSNLSDKAMQLHEAALASLMLHEYEARDGLLRLVQSLVALESTLHLALAARVVRPDVEVIVRNEVDALQRYLKNHYLKEELPDIFTQSQSNLTEPTPRKRTPRSTPKNDISSEAASVHANLPDRAARIKTVLEARPQVTIKDIASVVTDVSEKTIQRELNSLIEKGEVVREGERRWSKYSLSQ